MGAAASTARENLGATAVDTAVDEAPLTCKLNNDQVAVLANSTNFTPEEVIALNVHYDLISSAKRDDGLINRSEFQSALGFTVKESLYVDRIFQLFDTNSDNCISFDEFLQSVSVLSFKGGTAEKIKCAPDTYFACC
ncbi:uncharacterized protein PITG_19039 [Phytophthora infestans T30-4]|uniref:EF-hand domain-containing protein n=1 Tax=Phytophthora infestans (strain T30-4) TaxID=403677 RepID=D0NZU2_PHYIT|nr:uncharacterized protein PITG_19039 [Phytophthora infestans T30-4]EEY69657.1 conserved hypothetical protein [Phytophthora infestans T30-4]|eukprot:XP_002997109.1 conserved hypothetical protein [Phytophthora infestans T30-4]